jgi:opacity protein-like surface antigen
MIVVAAPITAQADSVDDIINDFTLQSSVYKDSAGIRIEERSVQYQRHYKNQTHRANWKLEAHDYDAKGETGSDTYHGSDIVSTISKEFNDYIATEISVGAVYLENQRTRDYTRFNKYKGKVTVKPNRKITINMEHSEDLLFKEAIIEDDTNKLVSGQTSKITGSWRAAERVIIEGGSQYRRLSDGNKSRHHRGAVLYGISTGTPWVWAGVEAQSLSYEETKSNYWSPRDYEAYSLLITGNHKITEKFSIDGNANINRTKENDSNWATGGAVTIGANYALTENTSIRADASYLESTRDNVKWDGSKVGISFVVSNF